MSKKPFLREALQALKPSEPYRQPKEKGPMQFRAPPSEEKKPRLKRSEIKANSDQNNLRSKKRESDDFDYNDFAPKGKDVELVEKDGDFHIPHRLFEFIHKALNTKVEILVFQCLLRNTLGYRNHSCQVSQTFIAKWTGIAAPNVRRALRELEESKMVVLRSPGGANHDRAIYEIPIVKAILKNKSSKKSISDQSDLRSNEPENRDHFDLTSEINLISNKEIENKREKKSLSPALEKYFENCSPQGKREREWGYFQKLSQEFSIADISLSLSWLSKNGIPNSKEPCHSPMTFLSQGIGQVLEAATEEDRKFNHRAQLENEKRQAEEAEREAAARDAERFEAAKKALVETYPNPEVRQQFLSEKTNEIVKGCPLPLKIAERLAIVDWYQNRATV